MPELTKNFWQRARIAVNYVFRNQSRVESKKNPYSTGFVGIGGTPQYSLTNYEEFYTSGYEENSLIYAAITYKAKAITQARLTAYKYTDKLGNFDVMEFGNDLQKLLDRPNKYQSGEEFHTLQNVFFNLTGNAFTYLERKQGQIVAMWPLNPAWVTIIADSKGEIKGYEYRPIYNSGEPFPILYEEMAHWKLPNPKDQLSGLGFGMSPVLAMANAGDIDNMISRFLNTFFKGGALPAGILKFKDMAMDDEQINDIREKWKEIYGGYSNWGDVGILDQYGDYQRIGFTFQELDFEKLDHRNETRIFASLGVPLELLPTVSGLTGSTYNNKSEARTMFWQDTMMYELNVVKDELARFFNNDDEGVFIDWDKSEVFALKGDTKLQVESANILYQMGMPPRIAFETVGLIVTDYEGIDKAKNLEPISPFGAFGGDSNNSKPNDSSSNINADENNPSESDTQKRVDFLDVSGEHFHQLMNKSSFDLETKKKIYKQFDEMIISHESEFLEASIRAFEKDRKEILSIITSIKKQAIENKASIIWNDAIDPTEEYLNTYSKTNWRNEFTPLIEGIYGDTENFWATQLGVQFNIRNIEGELALNQYTLKFSNQIAKTNSDNIKAILQNGYSQGYTIEQMSNEINDLYDGWTKWRGELISRTETTRAANDGARKLYKRWGIEQKEWLATADDRTRDTHLAMNGQVKDIDEPFESPSGAELMQPGDSSAPLAETAACRCTTLPVVSKDVELKDPQNFVEFTGENIGQFENRWSELVSKYDDDLIDSLQYYTGDGYADINSSLRGLSPMRRSQKELIDKMLEDFEHELGQNTTLYRSISDKPKTFMARYGISSMDGFKGTIIEDKGFMSTSLFGNALGENYPIQMQILANANTKGVYLESVTQNAGEQEFLLPPNSKLEIVSAEKVNGILNIVAKLL